MPLPFFGSLVDQSTIDEKRNEFIKEKRRLHYTHGASLVSIKHCNVSQWGARIVGCRKSRIGVWMYDVVVCVKRETEWGCYMVRRRFNDFRKLYQALKSNLEGKLPPFPHYGLVAWLSPSPAVAIHRIKPLQLILNAILLSSKAKSTDIFAKFTSSDSSFQHLQSSDLLSSLTSDEDLQEDDHLHRWKSSTASTTSSSSSTCHSDDDQPSSTLQSSIATPTTTTKVHQTKTFLMDCSYLEKSKPNDNTMTRKENKKHVYTLIDSSLYSSNKKHCQQNNNIYLTNPTHLPTHPATHSTTHPATHSTTHPTKKNIYLMDQPIEFRRSNSL